MGIENFFKTNFFYHNRIAADMDRNTFFLSKVLNIGLEYLVIILLVVSVATIFLTSTNINVLITQLAVYAAVAFKMMPSINRSLNAITGLKYGAPVINLIFEKLNLTMADRKAVVKNADMSEDMQQDAIDISTQALEKFNIEKDIAAFIKKEFDKKYNPTWHCIVGRNFGSYVTHETKHFIYFYLGQVAILLFKSG